MAPSTDKGQKVSTATLLSRIFRTKSIDSYIKNNKKHLYLPPLAKRLEELCLEKDMEPRDVVKNADIERSFAGKIFRGQRVFIHRDYIIKLAIGFQLDFDECQKLIAVAREHPLHPREERDAVIISCFRDKLDILKTENRLYEMKMPLLGEKRDKKERKTGNKKNGN